MNNHTRTQLDQLADIVASNYDGMKALAALLTCAACHPSEIQRPDDLHHGLAGLISALAWREQEAIDQLSNLTRDLKHAPFKGEPVHVPTPAELLADKNRYLADVLEHHGLTLEDLRDLKAGLVVLMAPEVDHLPPPGSEHSGRAQA